jgi:anti-sigma factor RsiW
MNCQDYEGRLGDYIDGTLDPAARAGVDAHLHACDGCRAMVADLAAIQTLTRGLEPMTPSPHVWQKIASATTRSPLRWRWSAAPSGVWQPLLASAAAVVLASGLWWIGARLSDAAGPAGSTALVTAESFGDGDQSVEAQYAAAIARLEQITTAERAALDVETAVVLDAGLMVIDEAIVESRVALETQPDNELAQDSLLDALGRKVSVLQEIVALIGDTRRGTLDPDAGTLSELNP